MYNIYYIYIYIYIFICIKKEKGTFDIASNPEILVLLWILTEVLRLFKCHKKLSY